MNTPQQPRSRSNPNRRTANTSKSSFDEWKEVLLFYVLPFLLLNGILFVLVAAKPKISIKVANTKDYKTTTATITVESLFPLKEFSSTQEGSILELTETKKGSYIADIVRNGVIEIYAKGLNGMSITEYEHVNILDDVAPLVGETYQIQDGILSLTLEDSQSGVDYQSVFAISPSGQTLLPLSSDKQTGAFTFPMEEEFLVIYANDLAGNGMQATFNTHIETLTPDAIPGAQLPPQDTQLSGQDTQLPEQDALLSDQNTQLPLEDTQLPDQNTLPPSQDVQDDAGAQEAFAALQQTDALTAEDAGLPSQPTPTTSAQEEDEIIIHINTRTP